MHLAGNTEYTGKWSINHAPFFVSSNKLHCSVLSPSTSTSHALIEASHRFICTPNLNLKEGSLLTPTPLFGALDLRLVCIVPSSRSSKHIFPLFSREGLPLIVLSFENKLVGAGLAFKAIGGSVVGR